MSDAATTRPSVAKALGVVPFVLAAYALLLNLSLNRPIWIDEFLHFAVAAEPSTSKAWSVIQQSITGVNHSQSGTYMMLDYWLISLFGAQSWALRLPSMVSGAFFMYASITLFRVLGYSVLWQSLAVIALFGQAGVMYYVGEARPYFPLVAACAGILLYYVVSPERRGLDVKVIGYLAAAIGVLFHPYFAAYWPIILVVGYTAACLIEDERPTARGLIRHANWELCLIGALVYCALARATWLRGSPSFSYDPFQWIGPSPWAQFSDYSHFQFLFPHLLIASICTAVAVALLALQPEVKRGSMQRLWAPLVLLAAMIALSIALGTVSYLRSYWILLRQMVASAALTALSVIWLWAEIGRISARLSPYLPLAVWLAAALAVAGQAFRVQDDLLVRFNARPVTAMEESICQVPPTKFSDQSNIELKNKLWVEIANQNISCGGNVWPIFRDYYK